MFEVRVFCEDKKLPELLWALDGKIVGMPQLLPVRDAKPSKDGSKVVATRAATGIGQNLYSHIINLGEGGKINYKEAEAVVKEFGGVSKSTGSFLTHLVRKGVLRRVDKGRYVVANTSLGPIPLSSGVKQHV